MMSILSLGIDIISIIVSYLNQYDIRNLRLSYTVFWKNLKIKEIFQKIKKPKTIEYFHFTRDINIKDIYIDLSCELLFYRMEFFDADIGCRLLYIFKCHIGRLLPKDNAMALFRYNWSKDPEWCMKRYCTKDMISHLRSFIPEENDDLKITSQPDISYRETSFLYNNYFENSDSEFRKLILQDFDEYRAEHEKYGISRLQLYYLLEIRMFYKENPFIDPFVIMIC